MSFWRFLTAAIRHEVERDAARGVFFLCLPILLAAGAAFYFVLPHEPSVWTILLGLVLTSAGAWLLREKPVPFHIVAALLFVFLGVAAASLETWRAPTEITGSDVTTNITGRLVSLEHQASGRVRLTIDLLATERPTLYYPPGRIRLTARSAPPDLRPGDGVTGLARLMSPSGPARPGAYDFSFTSYFDRRGAVGFFMSGPDHTELEHQMPFSSRVGRLIEAARLALAERIRQHVSGPEGEVAVAIITGFRAGIPDDINEWLRRTGLAHILSISGLHMALVAMTMMFMLRATAACFPGFSSQFPVKKFAAVAALVMCTLYLCISGADVAAERSYIMLAIMLAALLFDRTAITMRNVAIAALIIIVISPHEVVGPSFQMSFAATAALVASFSAWTEWHRKRTSERKVRSGGIILSGARYAAGFILGLAATSIIAGAATALYGAWHFQRATPFGLPTNLVAMPIISALVMPSAVLAMLAMPFGLEGFFLKVMGQALGVVIAISKWFSEHTPSDAVGLIPASALLAMTGGFLILVVSTTWIRLAALPLLFLGFGLIASRDLPDALIAEDARLVAIRGEDDLLAVNRSRFSSFVMDDWTRALMARTILKPHDGSGVLAVPQDAGFACEEELCVARHHSGALVAHAQSAAAARVACDAVTLMIVDDAVETAPCGPDPTATIITKRDLARRGSAAVRFLDGHVETTFAIDEPWRPWHEHRAWSRAARGLPPYRD